MDIKFPDDITFQEWVIHVFDHSENDKNWSLRPNTTVWDHEIDPEEDLLILTKFFKNPAFVMETYSHVQIDMGLYYLVSPSCSDYMWPLIDETVRWETRRECIHAMFILYRDLMAPLYKDIKVARSDSVTDPAQPNHACYMWWDVIILWSQSEVHNLDELTDAVFYVFENGLKLNSEACLESILHGLAQWSHDVPERVVPLVQNFIQRRDISRDLRIYAQLAMNGEVI